uniref:Calcineurin-like phosphoesterase domain-containing protein n=1 Tax=Pyricularia oryzae (strain P131) TaxID=1143193 RepID=L7JS07_PYRO1
MDEITTSSKVFEKDLYLHTSDQRAWVYIALANEQELAAKDLLVMDIIVGDPPQNSKSSWERRPGGIWVRRGEFNGKIDDFVTEVDVLFGMDAVDPRPEWALIRSPIQLKCQADISVARLSILHGRAKLRPRATLRVRDDGKFRIVQISDTHMVTDVGLCKDAIDAHGNHLPWTEADPLTVKFIGEILDIEKPDLVVLTGDQLHHDICDSQSALFKVVAPIIERSIPFAAVFGNYDSEGTHALSRTEQMRILESLPYSLSFLHIPLPEFGDPNLIIRNGHRGEPSENPSRNTHFYDALAAGGVQALGCGHDHVNDFCGLLPLAGTNAHRLWLCYAGGAGFGGYCSYGRTRFHRRMRVWELNTNTGSLTTWKRVEYCKDRVDELLLVEGGAVVDNFGEDDGGKAAK